MVKILLKKDASDTHKNAMETVKFRISRRHRGKEWVLLILLSNILLPFTE